MKKIIYLIAFCVLMVGCVNQQERVSESDLDTYKRIKTELMNQVNFDKDYSFDIKLIYTSLDDKYLYDIIIDNVSADMYYIQTITYGNEDNEEICPNIGIFDDEVYHLKKGVVDKKNHFYKGLQLSGTIDQKQPIKVYVKYYADEEKTKYIENFIEVTDEIR